MNLDRYLQPFHLKLSMKLGMEIHEQPESGMSYHIVSITLKDGRVFERVPFVAGILSFEGLAERPPFAEADIASVQVTHDKSGPPRLRKSI